MNEHGSGSWNPPSHLLSAVTIEMVASYLIGSVDVRFYSCPPLPRFVGSVSSLVLFLSYWTASFSCFNTSTSFIVLCRPKSSLACCMVLCLTEKTIFVFFISRTVIHTETWRMLLLPAFFSSYVPASRLKSSSHIHFASQRYLLYIWSPQSMSCAPLRQHHTLQLITHVRSIT